VSLGLYGGAFDPPHNGHVALAEAALEHFALKRLIVLVVAAPGHKEVALGIDERLRLAHLAFDPLPRTEVRRDDHARTVDTLREGPWEGPVFLLGADELARFLSWKDPNGVLELARLGVASRLGYGRPQAEPVLAALDRPERIEFFEIPAVRASSKEIRARLHRGESVRDMVPESVAREIEDAGLYR
jgi:nicotinate-nucleotide adenylyltransferase